MPDYGFSLVLPAGWVQRPRTEAGADVFQSADGSAQVTVSSFSAAPRMNAAERDQMLTRLLEHRRNAERQGMGPRMTAGEPQRTSRGEVVSAQYEGHDVEAGHRFATLVVVSAAGAWAVFLESPAASESFVAVEDGLFAGMDVTH